MRIRLTWDGNEDGAQRYLVWGSVKTIHVEILVQDRGPAALEEVSFEEPTIAISEKPDTKSDTTETAGQYKRATIVVAPLDQVHRRRFSRTVYVKVEYAGERAVAPLLILPRWQVIAATLLTSTSLVLGAIWLLDVLSAIPRGHLSVAIEAALGLPIIAAGVVPQVRHLVKGWRPAPGRPPWYGVFHRIGSALVPTLGVGLAIFVARQWLMTVHNDTDVALPINAEGKLGPSERRVRRQEPIQPIPNVHEVVGHQSPDLLDRLFEQIEPPARTLRCDPFRIQCSAIVTENGVPPTPLDGADCDALSSRDCTAGRVVLRADVLAAPATVPNAKGPVEATLTVNVPFALRDWGMFFQAQLIASAEASRPRALFERTKTHGPERLELRPVSGTQRSAVAVTPFERADQEIVVTIDEGATRGDVRSHDDVERVKKDIGGELVCKGLRDSLVPIVQWPGDPSHQSITELRLTADRGWTSAFTAHRVDHAAFASRAWQCQLPNDAKSVSYRIVLGAQAGAPLSKVELQAPPAAYDFELLDETPIGKGKCNRKDSVLRRYRAPRVTSDVWVSGARQTSDSDTWSRFKPAKGREELWFCIPPDATSIWAHRANEDVQVSNDAIEFRGRPPPIPPLPLDE